MSFQNFNELLEIVSLITEKRDTQLKKAFLAQKRLAITLHNLATGILYSSLSYVLKI